ncbi:MAG: protein kinase [Myxococcaceae bacterium]
MAQLQTAAQLLTRLGAVPPETAVRLLVEACEALQPHGPGCALTLATFRVSEEAGTHAEVDPTPFSTVPGDAARAQVTSVAAVGYELLRGMPPPERPDSSSWFGVRPELAALLGPALIGSGPANVSELAHQLRTIARPGTAQYVAAAPVHDTVIPARPAKPTPADKHVGEVFGSWELTQRLGSGGMGDVYQARHVRLGREAAIKLLKPEYASDPEIVHRFFDEARVVNEINHPHIVEIHDFVEEPGGRVYCVMELLSGRSLADVVTQDGPLEPKRVAAIFAQVCDALQAAHDRGVVHRDIKPDNIFITADPAGGDFARVLDFGVARRLSNDRRTQQGLVLGTLHFMAPEQAAGRAVDGRADLYSVGVSMVEALTARAPGDGAAVVPAQTPSGEPLHPAMVALLNRCLSLDPSGRPRNAAELKGALQTLATGDGPRRPTTDAIQAAAGVGPRRNNRGFAIAGGALVLIAAVVVFVQKDVWFASAAAPPVTDGIPVAPAPVVVAPEPKVETPPEPVQAPPSLPAPTPAPRPVKAGSKHHPQLAEVKAAPVAPAPKEEHPFAARAASVQRTYDALVARYGESQLTTIERAAVREALDDARAGRDTQLASSIPAAESALEAASHRLSK